MQLVDPQEAPYSSLLRQLAVTALCTNRDLPALPATVRIGDTGEYYTSTCYTNSAKTTTIPEPMVTVAPTATRGTATPTNGSK